jgi:hypothetical protein
VTIWLETFKYTQQDKFYSWFELLHKCEKKKFEKENKIDHFFPKKKVISFRKQ